ncbi:hypothetical protein ACQ4PT_052652 [Festuca glaucescens]
MSNHGVHPLFLLCILAIATHSCSSADSLPPPVYDTDGHELRADTNYYVLPANSAHGGGLTMAPGHGRRCPLFVAQEPIGHGDGLPVRITLHGGAASDQIIRLSADVRIHFRAYTTCVQSTEWHIDSELLFGRRHVITGPVREPSPTGREKRVPHQEVYWRRGGARVQADVLRRGRELVPGFGEVFRDGKGGAWFLGATEPYHVVVFKRRRPPFKVSPFFRRRCASFVLSVHD